MDVFNNNKYKIYNIKEKYFYNVFFDTLEELLMYISRSQNRDNGWGIYYRKGLESNFGYCNKWLDNINLTLNDTRIISPMDPYSFKYEYDLRPYVFLDPQNRILDLRIYIDKIIKYSKINYKHKYNYIYSRYEKSSIPYFRQGPIPGTGVKHNHRGSVYRHPQYIGEKKLACDKEIKKYIRPKRTSKYLPDPWMDEKVRNIDNSWKTSYKCRHQWEKNKK